MFSWGLLYTNGCVLLQVQNVNSILMLRRLKTDQYGTNTLVGEKKG